MKTEKKIVVYDSTFGYGPKFYVTEAELSEKSIKVHSTRHRKSSIRFAIATPELAKEAKHIQHLMDAVNVKAHALRKKLV